MRPSRSLFLVFLLAPSLCVAQKPPRKLKLSDLRPTPQELSQITQSLPGGFTLNREVVERYGYTWEDFQARSQPEQRRISDWIESMEAQRLAAPKQSAPAKPKWSSQQLEAVSRIKAGTLFDNSGPATSGGPSAWEAKAALQETDLRKFSLHNNPHDFTLEFGDLGAGGVNPQWGQSPYLNLTKGSEGTGSVFDYGWHGQAAMVHSRARLFSPDNPAMDARAGKALDGLSEYAPGSAGDMKKASAYSTDFESSNLFVGSLLGHVGRAYNAFGSPIDLSWSAMGLMKVTGIFPNVTLDQSVGARINVSPDHKIGVFGGLTEAAGMFSKSVVGDSIQSGNLPLTPHVDLAPHASMAAWGKVPYLSSVQYEAEAGRQWNPWTTVQSVAGSLSGKVGNSRVGVHGALSHEAGDIEYERNKTSVGVSYSPTPGTDISADYARDHAGLGNAELARDSVMLSLRLSGKESEPTVTFEELMGGKDRFILPDTQAPEFMRMLNLELGVLQGLVDSVGQYVPGGVEGAWQQAQQAYNAMDPALKQSLNDAWKTYLPEAPPLEELVSRNAASDLKKATAVAGLLSDPGVLDRILTGALRAQVLANLHKTEIPLLGHKFKMNAPMVLAAAHAYSVGVTPLPGVTAEDARNWLDPRVLKELSGTLGCGGTAGQALSDCLIDKMPAADREAFKKAYGKDVTAILSQAVTWTSDIIRREMNLLILQVMIAAERLSDLNVDKGERIGDINVRALRNQFGLLDERARKTRRVILSSAIARVGSDVKEQDAAMRLNLADYGKRRLAWLESQPAWPRNVQIGVKAEDWPALLAIYGDEGLFRLILQAKAKLAEKNAGGPARLYIELNDNQFLDGLGVTPGDPAVVSLPRHPPKTRDLDLKL